MKIFSFKTNNILYKLRRSITVLISSSFIKALKVPEDEKQRSKRSDGVLIVRRVSLQAVTKYNGAYNAFTVQ